MTTPPPGYTAEELERDNPYNQWMHEDLQHEEREDSRAADDEPALCPTCNGSGEGMYEGTRCHACKGKGEL